MIFSSRILLELCQFWNFASLLEQAPCHFLPAFRLSPYLMRNQALALHAQERS
jgi:hypothetical protein